MNTLVIIPCHNEELSITATIASVYTNIQNPTIWVIDNLSSDLTAQKATESGATVLSSPQLGKGYAIRHAFSRVSSDFDLVLIIDGDDTYGTAEFTLASEQVLAHGFDMVVGDRVLANTHDSSRTQAFRSGHSSGNYILSKIFKLLFGIEIKDTQSGWRVMSIGFVKSFTHGASEFEIETELNAHAYLLNAAVSSLPVEYRGRHLGSSSKLQTYGDGIKILRKLLHLFRAERPLIAYSTLGLPWLISSLLLFTRVLPDYFQTLFVSKIPSLIAGVGCFIIASLLWVTGMLLEKVRLIRVEHARSLYSNFMQINV